MTREFSESRIPLAVSVLASLLVHIVFLVPAFVTLLSSAEGQSMFMERPEPDDVTERTANDETHEVQLGIDSRTPSTFTWIGYEEYKHHLAALAQVEQAAFHDEQSYGGEVSSHVTAKDYSLDQKSPQIGPKQAYETLSLSEWLDLVDINTSSETNNDSLESSTKSEQENERLSELIDEFIRQAERHTSNQIEQPAELADGRESEEVGDLSDKQSDPTSIIEVSREQWQLGQPLAGQGLELKPQRPSFTILTLLTAAPRNPLARIEFDQSGIPMNARLIEDSGDPRVDAALLASLYRWRATGQQLKVVTKDQSLPVTIRILLTTQRSNTTVE